MPSAKERVAKCLTSLHSNSGVTGRSTMEIGPNQSQFLQALESGNYRKCRETLRSNNGSYCAFGVACDVSGLHKWYKTPHGFWQDGSTVRPPEAVVRWLGLRDPRGTLSSPREGISSLLEINDQTRTSLKGIAAFIRKYADLVFVEPR